MSEQMTEAQPRVSTAGRRLMMALRLAIRPTPMARTMVTMAGRPSGMAGHRQRHGGEEHVQDVPVLEHTHPEHDGAHPHTDQGEHLGHLPHLSLERGLPLGLAEKKPGDLAISVSSPVAVTTTRPPAAR